MKTTNDRLTSLLAAGVLVLALPLAAHAQPMMGSGHHQHMQAGQGHHGAHMERGRHHAHGDKDFGRMLHGLNLTEEQRDKVFAVWHAQAPQLRAKGKEARNARRELSALTLSDGYDDARATALAETLSRSTAEIALIRARSANEIYRVLGPEQRRQLQERMAMRESGRRGRGHARIDQG